jgi:hypothetical protein
MDERPTATADAPHLQTGVGVREAITGPKIAGRVCVGGAAGHRPSDRQELTARGEFLGGHGATRYQDA